MAWMVAAVCVALVADGAIVVPEGPGLGYEPDMVVLETGAATAANSRPQEPSTLSRTHLGGRRRLCYRVA